VVCYYYDVFLYYAVIFVNSFFNYNYYTKNYLCYMYIFLYKLEVARIFKVAVIKVARGGL
jgi:hypothetical protein